MSAEPCDLCRSGGGIYQMDRPCCVARWMRRQPPKFDPRAFAVAIETERGAAFLEAVRQAWRRSD